MLGWILHKHSDFLIKPETYEIQKLIEEGTTYFALALIRHLEKLGVYSFNSANSIDIVKDKLYQFQVLAESGQGGGGHGQNGCRW